jgi:hypothetical protein
MRLAEVTEENFEAAGPQSSYERLGFRLTGEVTGVRPSPS